MFRYGNCDSTAPYEEEKKGTVKEAAKGRKKSVYTVKNFVANSTHSHVFKKSTLNFRLNLM